MTDHRPICDYEGSEYQKVFWEEGGRAYEDAAEAAALAKLLPASGNRLLELGAGAGRNTPRYRGFDEIVLLDYSTTQLAQARERLGDSPRYRYIAADVYHMPFMPGLFDAATMIRTLHHLHDAPPIFHAIRELLQKDAIFILEFANKHNIKAIARWLLRKQSWSPFSKEPVEFVALNYDFHPKAIREWLFAAQFAIERQLTVSHFRTGFLKARVPAQTLAKWDNALQWTGDFVQLTPSVFLRSRAIGPSQTAAPGQFFCCPVCRTPLEDTPPQLTCQECGRSFPVVNGIYNFKIDQE
ncbi:MAG TPA: methyltransferase domain-containing protein [Chloroflexi bacterium]|nr:methyltransferase domain-containing protein [Chloroflexota bacterium]